MANDERSEAKRTDITARFEGVISDMSPHQAESEAVIDADTLLSSARVGERALVSVNSTAGIEAFEKEPGLVLAVYESSIASDLHPERNEDKLIIDRQRDVFAVFDGVGGQDRGDVASAIAMNTVSGYEDASVPDTLQAWTEHFKEMFKAVNKAIREVNEEAATTAVVAKIHELEGELYASIAHSGDSRAYILRGGILKAVTVDHTTDRRPGHREEAMQRQERLAEARSILRLSAAEAEAFNFRNIISAVLGHTKTVRMDVCHIALEKGDMVILTSDGVHDNLTTTDIQTILGIVTLQEAADALTSEARWEAKQHHIRSKMDDITAVVLQI